MSPHITNRYTICGILKHNEMYSCMFNFVHRNDLGTLARRIVLKLISSPVDSIDGISLAVMSTRFKHISMNVNGRRVLQQHYGMNKVCSEGMAVRTTYNYPSVKKGISTDPLRVITKPYCNDITRMAYILHQVINHNKNSLCLGQADISCPFNHCTILMYYSLPNIKDKSHMGFHTDIKYDTKGKYCHKSNTQRYKTPTVIYSIGDERLLKWIKRTKQSGGNWTANKVWSFLMYIRDGSVTIVNHLDETPDENPDTGERAQYQHGGITVGNSLFSIGFAFRNVDCERLHSSDNCMIPDIDIVPLPINGMYEGMDKKSFQSALRAAYKKTFG